MSKKMLINATHAEENRVAIVEDGILSELDIEITGQEQTKGNIYKGVVSRVEPGLQAAFIDFGSARSGFLQMGEIHPDLFPARDPDKKERPRINDILHRGQELLIQIVKEERGNKGAALTTYLSLPGRYMVLMPQTRTQGISRKINEESERKKLKEAMKVLELPQDMGYIIRTAGIGKEPEELKRDLDYLLRLYKNILRLKENAKAPALVYRESNLIIRSVRDYFMPDMDEVLIDDPKVFKETRDFFEHLMPEHARLVKLHQERRPIYSRYQIEEQIENLTRNHVDLPSGGSIVIDPTEALVAIDVNSGKMATEKGVEATAFKTNLEAVTEVARQLRLRDLGGLVVLDLIDMRDRKHIREVEKTLKKALKDDKARVTVGRISQFGLLEMSRQRIKSTLAAAAYNTCPHCGGSGRMMTAEARALAFLRRIHAGVAKGQIGRVEGRLPLDVAAYLLNNKRRDLYDLENRLNLTIALEGRTDFLSNQMELELVRRSEIDSPAPTVAQDQPATAEAARSEQQAEPDSPLVVGTRKDEEGTAEEEPKKRRRRRRRRSRRSSEGSTEATESAAAEAGKDGEPPAETKPEAADAGEVPTEEKPKRPRRSRKKADESPQESAPQIDAAADAPAEEKPQRPRRTRKKPVEVVATTGVPAAVPETSEETPAEEKPKRTRRPRKKAGDTIAPAEAAAATTTETTAEPAAEEKPKRRGRPRKKTEETVTKEPSATTISAEAPTEEKPKRTRRPRKKAEGTSTASETAPAAPAPAEEPKTEEKPKRRGRPRKKAEEPAAAVTPAPETSGEASAEEKPKRRGRPRKKPVEPVPEDS